MIWMYLKVAKGRLDTTLSPPHSLVEESIEFGWVMSPYDARGAIDRERGSLPIPNVHFVIAIKRRPAASVGYNKALSLLLDNLGKGY